MTELTETEIFIIINNQHKSAVCADLARFWSEKLSIDDEDFKLNATEYARTAIHYQREAAYFAEAARRHMAKATARQYMTKAIEQQEDPSS